MVCVFFDETTNDDVMLWGIGVGREGHGVEWVTGIVGYGVSDRGWDSCVEFSVFYGWWKKGKWLKKMMKRKGKVGWEVKMRRWSE